MATTEPKDSDAPASLLEQADIRNEPAMAANADWDFRLSVATAAAGLGVWDWDVVANTFVYSPRAKEIYGFPPDSDVTYDMVFGATHPDDTYKTREQCACARSRYPRDPDLRVQDHTQRWFDPVDCGAWPGAVRGKRRRDPGDALHGHDPGHHRSQGTR